MSAISHPKGWSLVVASNDERVLESTLLASPAIDDRCQVLIKRGFRSAAAAYNSGLRHAAHDIVVFAHQDVYLPGTWVSDLESALNYLTDKDPNWGVLGVFGVASGSDRRVGYCYSTGLKKVLGQPFTAPIRAESLDELLLVVRKSSGLRYDDSLPGFHLYGTDMCLQAKHRQLNSYIIPAFCIHNSIGVRYLSKAFWRSYFYLQRKWRADLPIQTCCTTITRFGWPIVHHLLSRTRDHVTFSVSIGARSNDPGALCQGLQDTGVTKNRAIRG